jgi:hypothetical protein
MIRVGGWFFDGKNLHFTGHPYSKNAPYSIPKIRFVEYDWLVILQEKTWFSASVEHAFCRIYQIITRERKPGGNGAKLSTTNAIRVPLRQVRKTS